MPGDDLSRRAEVYIDTFVADLERYAAGRGQPAPEPCLIDPYLNMPRSERERLDEAELAEIGVELARYGYYLQDAVNRKQVVVEKCDHEIRNLVFGRIHRYDAYRDEDKLLLATLDHEHARALHDVRANAQSYITRNAWLGQRLADVAFKFESYRKAKYGKV